MNTELRLEPKTDYEKANEQLSRWKVNEECKKTQRYQTCRNHQKEKLFSVRTKLSINKMDSKNLLVIQMNIVKEKMNKPVYLAPTLLDISKTLMYELQDNDIKPKYQDKSNLSYMDKWFYNLHEN